MLINAGRYGSLKQLLVQNERLAFSVQQIDLLLAMKQAKEIAVDHQLVHLDDRDWQVLSDRYDQLIFSDSHSCLLTTGCSG